MTSMPLPEARRTIVVLTSEQLRTVRRDPELADFADDDEVALVSTTSHEKLADLLRNQGVLRKGAVLLQSPYDVNSYVPPQEALQKFTVDKFNVLSTVAKLLGATRLSVTDVTLGEEGRASKADLEVKAPTASVNSTTSLEQRRAISNAVSKTVTFAGGAPDPRAARKLLRTMHLANDSDLIGLIDLRDGANAATSIEVTISSSREASRAFATALDVATGLKKLKVSEVSTSVTDALSSSETFYVQTRVDFE